MHTPTGDIYHLTDEDLKSFKSEFENQRAVNLQEKMVSLTEGENEMLTPLSNGRRKGWMRNQPCICGSGKKFKKCCWSQFK